MKQVADAISGYSYGAPDVSQSAVSMSDLDELKRSASFTEDDERYLRLAGEVEYLRTFVRQLRKKLEDNAGEPRYILTESYVGYRFSGDE